MNYVNSRNVKEIASLLKIKGRNKIPSIFLY